MTVPTTSPLVLLRLLADHKKSPAAVMLRAAGGASELAEFAAGEDFRSLVGAFPCLIDPEASALTEEALAALEAAGCRRTSAAMVVRADGAIGPNQLAQAQWLDGNWYLAPPPKPTGNQAASRALALQLVQLVAADADTYEIEAVFRRDPSLSYHLLRIVNSLAMGTNRQITSFSQAILILGRQQLRRWLNLMLFSARAGDERTAMLLGRAAARARTMELLAKAHGLDKANQDQAFMAGMFSLLGVLFGLPLAEVLRPLKISGELQVALLEHGGELGRLLSLTEAADAGNLAATEQALATLGIGCRDFSALNVQAYGWMLSVVRDQQAGSHA